MFLEVVRLVSTPITGEYKVVPPLTDFLPGSSRDMFVAPAETVEQPQ